MTQWHFHASHFPLVGTEPCLSPRTLLLLTVPNAGCSLLCRGPQLQVSSFLIFLLNFTHVVFLKMSPLLNLWAEND